jgi:peptidoglycan/xylan/chitin deacetylase (PgdA/CDA1 family)
MILGGARYLVRFDDICPGMNWPVWRQIEKILADADVKPMLAVVPQNQDAHLDVGPKEARFWEHVRGWQARGWTIGLHGYQHRYVTRDAGLIGINELSEFAGLPAAEQAEKLERAVAIFRAESVRADVWIAPAHSFDAATVTALRAVGIGAISDGFFLSAHRDERGMLWVPQQLWSFRYRLVGLWTVCYHHNDWSARDLERFAADVAAYRARITNFAEIASATDIRTKSWQDTLVSTLLMSTRSAKSWIKSTLGRGGGKAPA